MYLQPHLRYAALAASLVISGIAHAADRTDVDALHRSIYRIQPDGSGYTATNPVQGLSARWDAGRTEFVYGGGRFSFALAGEPAASRITVRENRIDLTHGDTAEWFVNDTRGVEQGFTVAARRGSGPLELHLDVSGDYTPAIENGVVVLRRDTKTALRYAGLKSWDAAGRTLPSRAIVEHSRIHLIVDDRGATYPVTVDPVIQEATLTASDGVAGDAFGNALAINGDTAILGVPSRNTVYIYLRNGNSWTQQQMLTGLPEDSFGNAVAIDVDTAVVGAYTANTAVGAVYVYTRAAGVWTQQAHLAAGNGQVGQIFGAAVAVSGDTLVVGQSANFNGGGFDRGQAFVFTRSGTVWSLQAQLFGFIVPNPLPSGGSINYSEFGNSVAISGDTILIGAPGTNTNDACGGSAFVYFRSGTVWNAQARLGAPDQPFCGAVWAFGRSVALDGDTALIGAPLSQTSSAGAAYFFTRVGSTWALQKKAVPSDSLAGDQFGSAVALNVDSAVIGAPHKTYGPSANAGAAYLFTRFSNSWTQQIRFDPSVAQSIGSLLGSAVGISRDAALIGVPGPNTSTGLAYVFRLSNVSLQSSPSGRSFTLSGAGCGANGAFTTPYTGFWSTCMVQWTSPLPISTGVRSSFQNWSDSSSLNPRTFTLDADPVINSSFTGNFVTEYQLATQASPLSGGTVSGAGWYPAGSSVGIGGNPNSGFVFIGFTGDITAPGPGALVLMDGPKSVTGNFTTTPPATLTAAIVNKAGSVGSRSWTLAITNNGPGIAYNAQIFVLSFVQTFGTQCTAVPVRLTPAALPVGLGTLPNGSGLTTSVTLDFSGCPANARFTVNLGYASNGGASGGLIQLVNQIQ